MTFFKVTKSTVKLLGYAKFIFNTAHDVGGALYLVSSSIIFDTDAQLEFVNNTGRYASKLYTLISKF